MTKGTNYYSISTTDLPLHFTVLTANTTLDSHLWYFPTSMYIELHLFHTCITIFLFIRNNNEYKCGLYIVVISADHNYLKIYVYNYINIFLLMLQKEGELKKYKNLWSGWGTRYFRLERMYLHYFESKDVSAKYKLVIK